MIRNLLLVAALFTAHFGYSQYFELRVVSGATLSGSEIAVAPNGIFEVEAWMYTPDIGTSCGQSLHVALAYDRSTTNIPATANSIDNRLSPEHIDSSDYPQWSPEVLASWTLTNTNGADMGRLGANGTPSNIDTTALGAPAYVWWASRGGGVYRVWGPIPVARFRFRNNMLAGEIYGDTANETGLQMYAAGTALGFGNSGISGSNSSGGQAAGPFGSPKYSVRSVPEPNSLSALALLGSAVLRRRRQTNR